MKKAAEGTTAFSKGVKIYVKAKGFSTKQCFALLISLYIRIKKSQYICATFCYLNINGRQLIEIL